MIVLLDARDRHSAASLLHQVHVLLPALYSAGLALPVQPEDAFEDDPEEPADERASDTATTTYLARWRPLFNTLSKQIPPRWNIYQEIFDPYAEPHEAAVTGSLADDLADIYCDLWRGRELWAQGQFGAAVWEWRFGFESHWGEHVTGALRGIRTLAAVHDLGFPGSDNVDG